MTQSSQITNNPPPQAHNSPQACPICVMWARMPYAKRWSTPTSIHDTESALIIGFWLGTQYRSFDNLCAKHLTLIERFHNNPSLLHHPSLLSSSIPSINPSNPPIQLTQSAQPFELGSKPFTNENSVQISPSPPIEAILTQAKPVTSASTQPTAGPGIDPVKLALEAALMPAVQGAKNTYTCPICGIDATMGDLHVCKGEE